MLQQKLPGNICQLLVRNQQLSSGHRAFRFHRGVTIAQARTAILAFPSGGEKR
jgi:hypothetical protein